MPLEELFVEAVWLYFHGYEQSAEILMAAIRVSLNREMMGYKWI